MSGSASPLGSDREATVQAAERGGRMRGARWIVRSTPERLVRIAAEFLQDEGFDTRLGAVDAFGGQNSEWTSAALEIGDERGSRRRWWSGLAGDEHSSRMPRALQRDLPPTLVVIAARPVVRGVAELVVFPFASGAGDSAHAAAAGPRIASALSQITEAAGAEGAMLSHESLVEAPDDGGPASRAAVAEVLGWR